MSFTITGPGLYKGRKGQKMEVIEPYSDSFFSWRGSIDGSRWWHWSSNGRFGSGDDSDMDIVGYWGEAVTSIPNNKVLLLIRKARNV